MTYARIRIPQYELTLETQAMCWHGQWAEQNRGEWDCSSRIRRGVVCRHLLQGQRAVNFITVIDRELLTVLDGLFAGALLTFIPNNIW